MQLVQHNYGKQIRRVSDTSNIAIYRLNIHFYNNYREVLLAKATESYHKALKSCKCGCIYNKDTKKYVITNDIWNITYEHIQMSRSTKTDFEKSKILKQELYSSMKECGFKKVSDHVKLSFWTPFISSDGNGTRTTKSLCESCYVSLQGHICK